MEEGPKPRIHLPREEAIRRGIESEERIERVVLQGIESKTLPVWIIGIRKSSVKENKEGIDAWLDTDAGPVELQIKSSKKEAQVGRKQAREKGVLRAVIRVNPRMSDDELREEFIVITGRIRNQLLGQNLE